jgi:hypothetical protein
MEFSRLRTYDRAMKTSRKTNWRQSRMEDSPTDGRGISARRAIGPAVAFTWSLRVLPFALALLGVAATASAQTEVVLHNFASPPLGLGPFSGVIRDAAGNFYGTT